MHLLVCDGSQIQEPFNYLPKNRSTDEWRIIKIPIDRLIGIWRPAESDIVKADAELLEFVIWEGPPDPNDE